MKQIFLFSIETQLTKHNICETYLKIIRHYNNKQNLDLYELKNFYEDMRIYGIFLMYNVNNNNLYLFSEFYKNIRNKRAQIKKLITNKIKSVSL